MKIAIARGNVEVLEYVLSEVPPSTDKLRAALRFCANDLGAEHRVPSMTAAVALLRHKMMSPCSLLDAMIFLDLSLSHIGTMNNPYKKDDEERLFKETVFALLKAGASPLERVPHLFQADDEIIPTILSPRRFAKECRAAAAAKPSVHAVWNDIIETIKACGR